MEWPLTGRDSIIRRLTADLTATNGTRGIEIVGEAGVGKTRLAAEVGRMLSQRGRATETVVASAPLRDIPFGAFAHLVRELPASGHELATLAALLSELTARPGDSPPTVVIVDDSHLLDQQSAALLRQLVTRAEGLVVLTRRNGESPPDALAELWSSGSVGRIELEPLSEDESLLLVESALDGPIDPLTFQTLWRRSEGNPLFIRELVEAGVETGVLRSGAAGWYVEGELRPPTRLVEVVENRMGGLDPAERDAAEFLAVAGALGLAALEQVADPLAVERLERRSLISVTQNGNRQEASLAHPLYGEVLGARMPLTRRRHLQRRLAEALEGTGARRANDVMRLAVWQLDGGSPRRPDVLTAAAGRALAAFDAELAERLARAALKSGRGNLGARLVLGEALAAQQRIEEGDEVLRLAVRRARGDNEILRAAIARANLLFFRAGRFSDAVAVLEAARKRVNDEDSLDEIDSLLALMRGGTGDLVGVAEAGRRLTRRPGARPRAVVHAVVYSSIASAILGRQSEAARQIDIARGLAVEVREELPYAMDLLGINASLSACYDGRPADGRRIASDGYRAAVQAGAADVAALWASALAESSLVSGDLDAGRTALLGALTVLRERDPFFVRGIDTALACTVSSQMGDADQARALWREASDEGLGRDVRSRIQLDRAAVWLAAGSGDHEAAADLARAAGERALSGMHRVWAMFIFHDAVRLGHADAILDRLLAVAEDLEGRLAAAMAQHARAAATRDGEQLDRAASAFESSGARLLAAEAAAQAQIAHLGSGNTRLAGLSAARAALLAAQCPGARTPALRETAPVALTAREREVARLARDGHTSPTIARRMQISVRTVDNHLAAVYGKLGISRRAELASVLGVRVPGDRH